MYKVEDIKELFHEDIVKFVISGTDPHKEVINIMNLLLENPKISFFYYDGKNLRFFMGYTDVYPGPELLRVKEEKLKQFIRNSKIENIL